MKCNWVNLKAFVLVFTLGYINVDAQAQNIQEIVNLEAQILEAKLRDELAKYAHPLSPNHINQPSRSNLGLPLLPHASDFKSSNHANRPALTQELPPSQTVSGDVNSMLPQLIAVFGLEENLRAYVKLGGTLYLVKQGSFIEGHEVTKISNNGVSMRQWVMNKQTKNPAAKESFYMIVEN